MSPRPMDLAGQKFGRWTVIMLNRHRSGWVAWLCRCECGTERTVTAGSLRSGDSKSCGCYMAEATTSRNVARSKHGLSGTPEFRVWQSMLDRCRNPASTAYKNYGGRGIRVCDRWQSFEAFYDDMGARPTPKHCIERDQVNGDYEPNNCRWATRVEQANNTRSNNFVAFDGRTLTVAQWGRETGLGAQLIAQRLREGWQAERALTTPNLAGRK